MYADIWVQRDKQITLEGTAWKGRKIIHKSVVKFSTSPVDADVCNKRFMNIFILHIKWDENKSFHYPLLQKMNPVWWFGRISREGEYNISHLH